MFSACKNEKDPKYIEADVTEEGPQSNCEKAPSVWFTAPITEPDFSTFPLNANNCDFHLWSWQEFLYLTTKDESGQRPFETMAIPTNLFVESGKPGAYPGAAPDLSSKRVLLPRHVKGDHAETAVIQAGGQTGALFDQKGNIVYYEARVNEVYYDFIKDSMYYNPQNIYNAPKYVQFPIGSLELKFSWRIASTDSETYIENASQRFITDDVLIAPLVGFNKTTYVVNKDSLVNATVALVGMHVVGHVNGHPEFIWATFEHVDNAPFIGDTPTSDPGPSGPWSFYKPGTNCNVAPYCNVLPANADIPAKPPYQPTEVCLVVPQGGGEAVNVSNLKSLNASVMAQQQNPVLKNYFNAGAIWTDNGELPPSLGNFKGSTRLENTTLETFFQGPPPKGAITANCFSCHTENPPVNTKEYPKWPKDVEINLSHLLGLSTRYKEE